MNLDRVRNPPRGTARENDPRPETWKASQEDSLLSPQRLARFKASLGLETLADEVRLVLAQLPREELENWFFEENNTVRAVLFCCAEEGARAGLLARIGEQGRVSVLQRVGRLSETSATALEEILEEARRRFIQGPKAGASLGGLRRASELLAALPSLQAKELLERLEEREPVIAGHLHQGLLTVHRLIGLFPGDLARLLASLPDKDLLVFLCGITRLHGDAVAEVFLGGLSRSRREDMVEGMGCLGPLPRPVVEECFSRVLDTARALRNQGRIAFPWEEKWVK